MRAWARSQSRFADGFDESSERGGFEDFHRSLCNSPPVAGRPVAWGTSSCNCVATTTIKRCRPAPREKGDTQGSEPTAIRVQNKDTRHVRRSRQQSWAALNLL
eukprot:2715823-Pleurochrysis_carterae.AAC.1